MLKKGDLVRFKHEHVKEMRSLGYRIKNKIMKIEQLMIFESWHKRKKRYSCMVVLDTIDDFGVAIHADTKSLSFYARPKCRKFKKDDMATQGRGRALTRKLLGLP
jgi:hypothetical protein